MLSGVDFSDDGTNAWVWWDLLKGRQILRWRRRSVPVEIYGWLGLAYWHQAQGELVLDQYHHHCEHHHHWTYSSWTHNEHRANFTVYVYVWPLLSPRSGKLSGHGGDPGVHVQRPDRLCRRRSTSGLKKQNKKTKQTKKQNKQRPDQTDFVGGDLPQVWKTKLKQTKQTKTRPRFSTFLDEEDEHKEKIRTLTNSSVLWTARSNWKAWALAVCNIFCS